MRFEIRDTRGKELGAFEYLEDALEVMRKDPRGYEVVAEGVVYARSWRYGRPKVSTVVAGIA